MREYDDGPRHREAKYRGTVTSVGTTQEELDRNVLRLASERKPWLLPEQLINNLSGETSAHHRIPLFDARRIHGLDNSASNFRAEKISSSMLSLSIDGTVATTSKTKARCCRLGTRSQRRGRWAEARLRAPCQV